jgi:hypothetical protein
MQVLLLTVLFQNRGIMIPGVQRLPNVGLIVPPAHGSVPRDGAELYQAHRSVAFAGVRYWHVIVVG